jgi:hypothetical protein
VSGQYATGAAAAGAATAIAGSAVEDDITKMNSMNAVI